MMVTTTTMVMQYYDHDDNAGDVNVDGGYHTRANTIIMMLVTRAKSGSAGLPRPLALPAKSLLASTT